MAPSKGVEEPSAYTFIPLSGTGTITFATEPTGTVTVRFTSPGRWLTSDATSPRGVIVEYLTEGNPSARTGFTVNRSNPAASSSGCTPASVL